MLTLAIQAGGESRRMGSDKALLPFLGQPLILRLLSRLAWIADEVIITSNQPENYRFLGLTPIPDLLPGLGALGGLYTALSAAHIRMRRWWRVTCPSPARRYSWYALALAARDRVPMWSSRARKREWSRSTLSIAAETCLPHMQEAIENGKRRADAWFEQVNIHYLDAEEIHPYDPDRLAFFNINTPEELKEAERLARNESPAK